MSGTHAAHHSVPTAARSPIQRIARAALVASLLAVVAVNAQERQERANQAPAQRPGQSATLLTDGRWLFLGGEGSERRAALWDPSSGSNVEFEATQPRAWHTATALPDGSVLVFGGVDAAGHAIAAPERFDPAAQTFQSLPATGMTPRAHHAASLLTDGRVLITGGQADTTLDNAIYWDSNLRAAEPVPAFLTGPRRDHSSTLTSDGRVSMTGGRGADGRAIGRDEVFDPTMQLFVDPRLLVSDPVAAGVAESRPQNGAIGLSTSTRVAVRFARPIEVRSATAETLAITGPDGAVPAQVVVAEGGRLLFITPTTPLRPESSFDVTLRGLRDAGTRRRVDDVAFWFGTGPDDTGLLDPAVDEEAWQPIDPSRWRTDRPESSWETQPRLQASAGVTAVSGQVLRLNSRPLADVTLRIGGQSTRTDRTGRFLLTGVPSGRQVLEIEGASASTQGRKYGFFEVSVAVTSGQTTA